LHASQSVLAAEPVGGTDIKSHLRSHVGEEGYTVCMHADDQVTNASLLVEFGAGAACAHVLLGSPCKSVYVPIFVGRAVGEPVGWDRFAGLRPSHRRALDELERDLVADASDDDEWANEAWKRVDDVLTALGV
jgi:hypothetical protein